MSMDPNGDSNGCIDLGAYALILATTCPTDNEYIEEVMISHIYDIMKMYRNNCKTLRYLCLALSNICFKRDDVKILSIKYKIHDLIISSSLSIHDDINLRNASFMLIRNISSHPLIPEYEYKGTITFLDYVLRIIKLHIDNENIIIHGCWIILNLLKSSLPNKISFVKNFNGLEIIKSLINYHLDKENIIEICLLLLQQLSKSYNNRLSIKKSNILENLNNIYDLHKDSIVIMKPFFIFLYRLTFINRDQRLYMGNNFLNIIIRPLKKKNIQSDIIHRYILKIIIKLSNENENIKLLKNNTILHLLISSLNQYQSNVSFVIRALTNIFSSNQNDEDEIIQNEIVNIDDESTKDELKSLLKQSYRKLEMVKYRTKININKKDNEIIELKKTLTKMSEYISKVKKENQDEIETLKKKIKILESKQGLSKLDESIDINQNNKNTNNESSPNPVSPRLNKVIIDENKSDRKAIMNSRMRAQSVDESDHIELLKKKLMNENSKYADICLNHLEILKELVATKIYPRRLLQLFDSIINNKCDTYELFAMYLSTLILNIKLSQENNNKQ